METSKVILIAIIVGLSLVFGFYPLGIYILPLFILSIVFYLFDHLKATQSFTMLTIISMIYGSIPLIPTIVVDFWLFFALISIHTLGTFISLACIYSILRKQVPDFLKIILIPFAWIIPEMFYLNKQMPWFFPFPILGYTQPPSSPLTSFLGGGSVILVSSIIILINVLIYLFVKQIIQHGGKWVRGSIYVVLIIAIFTFGFIYEHIIISTVMKEKNVIDVVCVQGGITDWMYVVERFDTKWQQMIIDTYLNLTNDAVRGAEKPDLIVWPETALHLWILDTEVKGELMKIAQENNTYILAGMPVLEEGKQYNSAVLFTPMGVFKRYDKNVLVPVIEDIFTHGTEAGIFRTEIGNIGVVLCVESLYPSMIKSLKDLGADYIVVLTNDGMFKKTIFSSLHFKAAQFRSLEVGLPVIQISNSGLTGAFDQNGNELFRSELFRAKNYNVKLSF